LADGCTLGPVEVQQILADSRIANPGTVVSAVIAPATLTLWLARSTTPPVSRGPYREIRPWDEAGPPCLPELRPLGAPRP
jgi:hypothetical protein